MGAWTRTRTTIRRMPKRESFGLFWLASLALRSLRRLLHWSAIFFLASRLTWQAIYTLGSQWARSSPQWNGKGRRASRVEAAIRLPHDRGSAGQESTATKRLVRPGN